MQEVVYPKTTKDHYIVCETCGPIIGKPVDWSYVRRGGRCLKCICDMNPSKLTEVKKEDAAKNDF